MADLVATVDVGASVRDAAEELMADAGVRHLPVGDGTHVAGIVSLRDVVAVLTHAPGR